MNKLKLYNILLEKEETPEQFKKRMNDAGYKGNYPEAAEARNQDMWLNMWAKDFIFEFTKELGKYVPPGGNGYCKKDYLHTYSFDSDREFNGNKSLYQELININKKDEPKLNICVSQLAVTSASRVQPWDKKFKTNLGEMSWWQLLNLDYGVTDRARLEDALINAVKYVRNGGGSFCNGSYCISAVYKDPLNSLVQWFKDPHNTLTVLELASLAIPFIGVYVSAGFGLANAALYLKDGNKKDAAISAFFAFLPGLGAVGSKIVSKMGSKGLQELSEKLIKYGLNKPENITKEFLEKNASKFTKEELEVLENISKNEKVLKSEMAKVPLKNPKEISEFISVIKNKSKATAVDVGINVGGVAAGLSAYPLFKKLNPGVREKIEKGGWDFEEIKNSFFSSGTKEDNLLMIAALNDGWEPGKEVPEKYQTNNYKEMKSQSNEIGSDVDFLNISPEDSESLDYLYKKYGVK